MLSLGREAGLPLALGTAWILARHHFPGKFIFDGIIHLPLVLPPVVIGYVLLVLMGKKGLIGSLLYEELGISLSFSWRGAAAPLHEKERLIPNSSYKRLPINPFFPIKTSKT